MNLAEINIITNKLLLHMCFCMYFIANKLLWAKYMNLAEINIIMNIL